MKLIITGATGFVATEVVRQALLLPSVTSVVAVARSNIAVSKGTDASKLKSVVVLDYGSYSDDVKKEFAGADACIWTVAVTPSKARTQPAEHVRKVCQEWTLAGFKAILEANPNPVKPFRFMYMSGIAASDPAHPHRKDINGWMPANMIEYSKMRGETATMVVNLAAEHKSSADVCIVKPGYVTGAGNLARSLFGTALWLTGLVKTIDSKELAAAMLEQVERGFEGTEGVLMNDELAVLGKVVLSSKGKQ